MDNLIDEIGFQQVIEMFDLMPDILFWIKDIQGHFLYANAYFLEHVGVSNVNQIIGLTDYDFSPAHIAEQFVTDDLNVTQGEIVTERLEMNLDNKGRVAWFTTSKRPLFNKDKEVIGSYGTSVT